MARVTHGGKGSARRATVVSTEEAEIRWQLAFSKDLNDYQRAKFFKRLTDMGRKISQSDIDWLKGHGYDVSEIETNIVGRY